MDENNIKELIRSTAKNLNLDPNLALAIAGHESNFNPAAIRFEPEWKYYYAPESFAKKLGITLATERTLQAMSWSVMQVMGAVAREFGFSTYLTLLSDPILGIFYGCKKLKKLYDGYENDAYVIAAYNAGMPRKINGEFVNQPYVSDVLNRLSQLRAKDK